MNYRVTYINPNTKRANSHYLWNVLPSFSVDIQDPLQSAIILDICRCSRLDQDQVHEAIIDGWAKEIKLSHTPNHGEVDFAPFFSTNIRRSIHPLLPFNHLAQASIYRRFMNLKSTMLRVKPRLFARYTRKNMSRSTRRDFERHSGISLEDIPIFGQDDWIRYYHATGNTLEGSVEMRQKWYTSSAKPRTYFAMGGTTYRASRFLQDFFTVLVNAFPSTNHITRLQPYRLRVPTDIDTENGADYFIYDLSSFTSNCQVQRNFCHHLACFFEDVPVEIVDEKYGPLEYTLGELLHEYSEHCVDEPVLNVERAPIELGLSPEDYIHENASMLGIYGNLMTCTLAHYMTVAPTIQREDEANVAGDDAIILIYLLTFYSLINAILLVGTFAMDKTFKINDSGAVCLKRPISMTDTINHTDNIVPPNLAVVTSYLLGYDVDPRFQTFYNESNIPDIEGRISVVGKDLMRFLDSCHRMLYWSSDVVEVYQGFRRLVIRITGVVPSFSSGFQEGRLKYIWPVDPEQYDFLIHDPIFVFCSLMNSTMEFDRRGVDPVDYNSLQFAGDEVVGNSDKRLKLLKTLGYITRESEREVLSPMDATVRMYTLIRSRKILDPVLYKFSCDVDIPFSMIF